MIRQFEVKNFKCHEDLNTFKFPGVTIVSGTNNSGKSSLLQSVYLLTQNKTQNYSILAIDDELKLGNFADILNKNQDSLEPILFSVSFDEDFIKNMGFTELTTTFSYKNPLALDQVSIAFFEDTPILTDIEIYYKKNNEHLKNLTFELIDQSYPTVYHVKGENDNGYCKLNGCVPEPIIHRDNERFICSEEFEQIRECLSFLNKNNIKYLKAFRSDNFTEKGDSNGLGLSGEYTAEVINSKWDKNIDFVDEDGNPYRFSQLFDKWIAILLGENYRIRSRQIDNDKFKIIIEEHKLGIEYSLNQVGFGISQILPIITLILTSKKGDVILIENPEVHLHPKLQAMFVDLCILASTANRKLIIETHSEHIINRIRLKIKQDSQLLNIINVYFFEKEESFVLTNEIQITKEGKLANWPKNFFDQSYNDLLGLID